MSLFSSNSPMKLSKSNPIASASCHSLVQSNVQRGVPFWIKKLGITRLFLAFVGRFRTFVLGGGNSPELFLGRFFGWGLVLVGGLLDYMGFHLDCGEIDWNLFDFDHWYRSHYWQVFSSSSKRSHHPLNHTHLLKSLAYWFYLHRTPVSHQFHPKEQAPETLE